MSGVLSELPCQARWLLQAQGIAEFDEKKRLEAAYLFRCWLWQEAAWMAAREGWQIERGEEIMRQMARIAMSEAVYAFKWSKKKCAETLGVSKSSYRRCWEPRMNALREVAKIACDEAYEEITLKLGIR